MIENKLHRSIETDLPCVNCGYNLRTLSEAARCPECGGEIAATLRAKKIYDGPGRLRRGAGCYSSMAWSILFLIFLALLTLKTGRDPIFQWLSYFYAILMFGCILWHFYAAFSLPKILPERPEGSGEKAKIDIALQISAVLMVIFGLLLAVLCMWDIFRLHSTPWLRTVEIAVTISVATVPAYFFCLMIKTSRVFRKWEKGTAASYCKTLAFLFTVLFGFVYLFLLLPDSFPRVLRSQSMNFFILFSFFAIVGCGLLALLELLRADFILREEARQIELRNLAAEIEEMGQLHLDEIRESVASATAEDAQKERDAGA